MSKREQGRIITLCLLFGITFFSWLPVFSQDTVLKETCQCLTVAFLDVGQGDAIYISTPDGHDMLVDGGRDASILGELSKQLSKNDITLDLVVATHPDLDHIGGLVDVLQRYDVAAILMTTNEGASSQFDVFEEATVAEEARLYMADAGQLFRLGASTTIQVFAPTGDESLLESNTSSIVLRIVYGDTSFLLSGDAPKEVEDYLVGTYGKQLDSDVLKLGHHGSKTSTSDGWLDAVTPTYAVVSASVGNSYGHPHQEVMQRVFKRNIESSHTGIDGTVTFQSDGQTVWRK